MAGLGENIDQQISELLVRFCDGTATKADMVLLETLLDNNKEAIEYCVDILMLLSCFQCFDGTSLFAPKMAAPIKRCGRKSAPRPIKQKEAVAEPNSQSAHFNIFSRTSEVFLGRAASDSPGGEKHNSESIVE